MIIFFLVWTKLLLMWQAVRLHIPSVLCTLLNTRWRRLLYCWRDSNWCVFFICLLQIQDGCHRKKDFKIGTYGKIKYFFHRTHSVHWTELYIDNYWMVPYNTFNYMSIRNPRRLPLQNTFYIGPCEKHIYHFSFLNSL